MAGLGVENHGEFVELVENSLGQLKKSNYVSKRQKSLFNEVEVRNNVLGTSNTEGLVIFESSHWSHKDLILNFLLKDLLGSANVSGNNEQPGLLVERVFDSNKSVFGLESFNMHFTDTGLFGIKLNADTNYFNYALEDTLRIISQVKEISIEELEGAKKRLKLKLLQTLGNDYKRIEEIIKQQVYVG